MGRLVRWQLASRLAPGPIAVEFVNGSRLLVGKGMAGATGNIYVGLHEYPDMAFCLHALRPGELFVDIGANVGSYTVLASAVGANVICVEPVPRTFQALVDNLRLNDLLGTVVAVNAAVGKEAGTLSFTSGLDSCNHVSLAGDADVIEVPVQTLDLLCEKRVPAVVKMDVEGYEPAVIQGGLETLARTGAVIAEISGHSTRYGASDQKVLTSLLDLGFVPCTYTPESRTLAVISGPSGRGNTVFVRDLDAMRARVNAAPTARIHGLEV